MAAPSGTRQQQPVGIVAVEGLSTSTTNETLLRMAQSIGPVQGMRLKAEEKRAFIKFHNPEHAKQFANSYNRHMLDLSMITISVLGP
jgi:hypothetical protein